RYVGGNAGTAVFRPRNCADARRRRLHHYRGETNLRLLEHRHRREALTMYAVLVKQERVPVPVIRRVREDELAAVLEMWQAAGVTPPSVSDSIEGLTRLIRE